MKEPNDYDESEEDLKAVNEAVAHFYVALNEMFLGNPEAFKNLWSHSANVTYLGADGGFHVGWEAVYSDWQAQANLGLGGVAEAFDIQITVGQDMAMAQSHTEHRGAKFGNVHLRESSVFRKEDGVWKMISHHADALPPLVDGLN